jgi:two-component system nitrogen regulation response regulator GlnG
MEHALVHARSSIEPDAVAPATVLVVDPDSAAREETAGWLSDAGYGVRDAGSFEDARRMLDSAAPEILLTAVRLGAFNGLHLIIAARAVRPGLRAILTTAAEDPALRGEADRLDVECLVKPVTRDALLAVVARGASLA